MPNSILIRGVEVGTTENDDGSRAVRVSTSNGDWIDRSGQIIDNEAAQTGMAANKARRAWFFQNLSDYDLWISFVGMALPGRPSVKVIAGGTAGASSGFVSSQALSVYGPVVGQQYTLWEA